jgi:hypothetical protein
VRNSSIANSWPAQAAIAMMKHESRIKNAVLVLGAVLYCLAVAAVASIYEGSAIRYVLFSGAAALMLWLGLRCRLGYGATMLSIFLWLGLWLKLSVNLFFSRPYTEATGGFEFLPHQYDELMSVATLVCLGVSGAWMISIRWLREKQSVGGSPDSPSPAMDHVPPISQKYLWGLLILAIALLNIANIQFGFVQSGLVARRIFPWPTNALAGWFLYSGLSFLVAALIYWDFLRRRNLSTGVLVALFEAALGGMTTISRGLYLWHVLPVFLAAWVNVRKFRDFLSTRALVFYSVLAMVGFLVIGTAVNVFRNSLYDVTVNTLNAETIYGTQFDTVVASGGRMMNLAVDRWVGAEGIMVAVGYPDKSVALFEELLVEKPSIGHVTKYQYIAKSHYSQMDANKYQFNTLPGVAGFLYLSGSFGLVFAGTFLLALSVSASERLIQIVSENPFICAMSGIWMANMVAQIGVTPRQLLPQIAMNLAVIGIISLAQAYWFRRGWVANKLFSRNKVQHVQ